MSIATVSGKGWVVIPQQLRHRYQIKKGDRVHFVDYGGALFLVLVASEPVRQGQGMLKGGNSLAQALLEARREDVTRE